MERVWTHGVWTVKPGSEEAFVRAWSEMRDAVLHDFGEVEAPTLLRDHERPNVFVSFGPWPDADHVARFRGSDSFKHALVEMGHLLDDFQTMTLGEVRS